MIEINGKKLNLSEIEHVVQHWYLNYSDDILQNEDGLDLEEVINVDYTEEIIDIS